MPGARKLCTSPLHQGPRWLLCIEFNVKQWNDDKTVPRRLHSHCRTCKRIFRRMRYKGYRFPYQERRSAQVRARQLQNRLTPAQYRERRRKQARRRYRDKRDPRLPFEPFQEWLLARINESSISSVAKTVGISWDRVRKFRDGFEYKGGFWRDILHVRFSTVEKFMTPYGDKPTLIYDPDLIEKYRAEQFTNRVKH